MTVALNKVGGDIHKVDLNALFGTYYSGANPQNPFVRTGEYFRPIIFRYCLRCSKDLYDDHEWTYLNEVANRNDDSFVCRQVTGKPLHCLDCAKKLDQVRRIFKTDYTLFDYPHNKFVWGLYLAQPRSPLQPLV